MGGEHAVRVLHVASRSPSSRAPPPTGGSPSSSGWAGIQTRCSTRRTPRRTSAASCSGRRHPRAIMRRSLPATGPSPSLRREHPELTDPSFGRATADEAARPADGRTGPARDPPQPRRGRLARHGSRGPLQHHRFRDRRAAADRRRGAAGLGDPGRSLSRDTDQLGAVVPAVRRDELAGQLTQLDVAVLGETGEEGECSFLAELVALHHHPDRGADLVTSGDRLPQVGDLVGVADGDRGLVREQRTERVEILERADVVRVQVQGALEALGVEQPEAGLCADTRRERRPRVVGPPRVGGEVRGDDVGLVGRTLVARTLLELVLLRVQLEEHVIGGSKGLQSSLSVADRDARHRDARHDLHGGSGDPAQGRFQVSGRQRLRQPTGVVEQLLVHRGSLPPARPAHEERDG